MIEFDFYSLEEERDKIKIYCEELQHFFSTKYNIVVESVDFDKNQNVILYIEQLKNISDFSKIEKRLMKDIQHLNDVEVRNMKIILTFDKIEIELC